MDCIVRCVLFFQLLVIRPSTPVETEQIFDNGDECTMVHSIIKPTFKRFGNFTKLELRSVNIPKPSQELFDTVANGIDLLYLNGITAEAIFVPYNLTALDFFANHRSKTQIIIDRNGTYKLEKLSLENLLQLPVNIDSLRSLKRFYCCNILEGEVDFTIFSQMTQLKNITVSNIASVTIPPSVHLPSLQKLEIGNSRIIMFKETYCEFPMLEQLQLDNNNLQEIPQCFSTIASLKHLYVARNKLQRVHFSVFSNLTQSEDLSLMDNQMSQLIAENITELTRLKFLYLNDNKLTTLNVTLWSMPMLKTLSLNGNQLQQVDGLPALLTRKVITLHFFQNPLLDCQWVNETVYKYPNVTVLANDPCFPVEPPSSLIEELYKKSKISIQKIET